MNSYGAYSRPFRLHSEPLGVRSELFGVPFGQGIDKDGIRNFTGQFIALQAADPIVKTVTGVFRNTYNTIDLQYNTSGVGNRQIIDMYPSRAVPTANDNRVLTASSIKWRRTN